MTKAQKIAQAISEIKRAAKDHEGDREVIHAKCDDVLLNFLRNTGSATLADAWDKADTDSGGFDYA